MRLVPQRVAHHCTVIGRQGRSSGLVFTPSNRAVGQASFFLVRPDVRHGSRFVLEALRPEAGAPCSGPIDVLSVGVARTPTGNKRGLAPRWCRRPGDL